MFKTKFLISVSIFITFLVITSIIKNKTRILEKQISSLNINIFNKKKNINETQLDFHFLTSPAEIEKRLQIFEFEIYQPIKHSNIFFDISDFTQLNNKISNLNKLYEKKNKKK